MTSMNFFSRFLALALFSLATSVFADGFAIIPQPEKIQAGPDKAFVLRPETRIYSDFASRQTREYLAGRLRPSTGFLFKTGTKWFTDHSAYNIVLTTKNAAPALGQ